MLPLDFHVPGPLLHPCLKQSAEVAACKIPEIFRQKLFNFLWLMLDFVIATFFLV
jgi:hypothetical protein